MDHPRLPRSGALALAVASVCALLAAPALTSANTSHAGWPHIDGKLVMDKGPAGESHVLQGDPNRHNELLGGYGNDTIIGGSAGDVIWSDYHPSGQPAHQEAIIHAGNGPNFIYSNDTVNQVWTGDNPKTIVHAHFGSGTIHCGSPKIIVYLSHKSRPHYRLPGCRRLSYYTIGY